MAGAAEGSVLAERVVGNLVERQASTRQDTAFLSFKDEVVTYAQLDERVNRVANGLLRLGVSKGDKVCLMLPNCPEFIYSWLGLARIGAVEVPINTFHRGNTLKYIINHSDAETIIVDRQYLSHLEPLAQELVNLKTAIVYPGDSNSDWPSLGPRWQWLSYQELAESSSEPPGVEVKPQDLLAIFYTGGTTGLSKGVMVSHNYALWSKAVVREQRPFTQEDVFYCCLPLFHGVQLAVTLTPLMTGGQLALSDGFSASRFWADIRRYRATTFMFVGAMLPILWKQPERADDRDHRVRYATGNPVPGDLHRAFEARFGLQLLQSYAMTEAMPITGNPYGQAKVGSCGRPIRGGYEVKVFDEDDCEVPAGVVGELVVRPREPSTLMAGYYKMPEETLRAFRNLWFHTGDLGCVDEEGYFTFVARRKDAIRRSGENISAFEVEQAVNSHPAVLESAAVAIPSDLHGEEVKIVVVLKEGRGLSPAELLDFCQARMAYFMVPRYVEFVQSLPKTAVHRVEKYKLQEQGIAPGTWDREQAGYKLSRA